MIISDGINKTEKYDETQEYFFSCRAMFRWLYEKGILKKISFLYKEEKDNICFALDTDDLIIYKNQMENSGVRGSAVACNRIFGKGGYKTSPSIYSGAVSLTWTMMDYRDISGCVTKSWELLDEKYLTNDSLSVISAIREKHGAKAAVKAIWDLYDDGKLSQKHLNHMRLIFLTKIGSQN